ncbi:alpha/beta family hydrolase [Stappia indica]|uniref:alpha/beta family hydrolase n=1 Tax=Stappia indica TaxID=538381 RepID=UPI001CD386F1|nr:alpha/beta family hydrolase [Stappia indica]MCA1297910.1 alpha/beta hydrolase [Stappia indica]
MTDLLWTHPKDPAIATLLLAHGAGAAMDSGFMTRFADCAAAEGLAVARFEFAYMAARRNGGPKRPPPRADKLVGEYQKVAQEVLDSSDTPLLIGGKSMGGRVAAMLAGGGSLPRRIAGVVCLGYPFHTKGSGQNKEQVWRLEPLRESHRPIFIAQGERDPFGSAAELDGIDLPDHVRLEWLPDGNHDLAPRGASPATWSGNLTAAAAGAARFARDLLSAG